VAAPCRSNQIAVHLSDELKGYLLGAHRFALAMIRATAEVFVHHRDHHAESPLVALGQTLRQRVLRRTHATPRLGEERFGGQVFGGVSVSQLKYIRRRSRQKQTRSRAHRASASGIAGRYGG
jgi:hypothetical protein